MPTDPIEPPKVTDLPKPPLADAPWFTKPARKVWVFAASNVVIQLALAFISGRWHFDLAAWLQPYINMFHQYLAPGTPAPGAQAILATGLSFVIAYLISPSFSDVYKHLTSNIVARAMLDTTKPDVSQPQVIAAVAETKRELEDATPPKPYSDK